MGKRSVYALIATAILAPTVLLSSRSTWAEVLIATAVGGAFLGCVALLRRKTKGIAMAKAVAQAWGPWGRWVGYISLLGNIVITSYGASMAMRAFPTAGAFPLYPVTLLLLGTWVAAKGKEAVGRFGGALCIFLVVPLLLVLAFGAIELKKIPATPTIYIDSMVPLLCLPLISGSGEWVEKSGKGNPWPWFVGIACIGMIVSIVTMGDLGVMQAKTLEEPFYVMTQSISLGGVMERFEVLVAAVLLLGFGVLLSYLMLLGREIATVTTGKPLTILQCVGALLLVGGLPLLSPLYLLVIITICWGVIPVMTLGIVSIKKP